MKEVMDNMDTVKCDVCDTIFTDCFSASTNQAYGCASDFYQNKDKSYVLSSYGSQFDTTRFDVNEKSELHGKTGVICDECIQNLLDKKEITKDESFDYWATLDKDPLPPPPI